jgi:beta-lactamase regulating signal transducer with metallopeptidase domain
MTSISIILKASILMSFAGLAHGLFGRRMSAAARHLMWTLVVMGLLLLPILSLMLPPWTAFTFTTSAGPAFRPALSEPHQTAPPLDTDRNLPAVGPSGIEPASAPASSSFPWSGALTVIYSAGVLCFLVRLLIARLSIRWLVRDAAEVSDPQWTHLLSECSERMNLRRRPRLLRSRDEVMPMTFGICRAAIVIPAVADTWPETQRRAVLLHELSHVIRRDCLTQLLTAVACAFYWFHPGTWWIASRLRAERELACDDLVLNSGANARDYAGHLLELAYALRSGRTAALAVSMAGSNQLEGRMLAILDAARNRAVPVLRSHIAGLTILLLLIVPLAAATISGRQLLSEHGPFNFAGDPSLKPAAAGFVQGAARALTADAPGTWEIRPTDRPRVVQLQLREAGHSYGTTIDLDHTPELPALPANGPVQFSLPRDAGTFTVEGVIRNGVGAGTFTFTPSATFAVELVKRGFERPTALEQRAMAGADIGFAFLDELAAQRYTHPAHVAELVQAARHGVSLSYLRGMGQLGYRAGTLDALIDLANHGISPEFIRELAAEGLPRLSTDDVRRVRTSGIDPEYIRELRSLGYPKLSLDQLMQLRRHGVDPDYIRDLAGLGYQKLSLDTLVLLRNHGVDPEYIRELVALGYQKLPLDTYIQLRNHGVDAEYARELGTLGYSKLPLETLIDLRNHGIDADYIRELQSLGYSGLKIEDLKRMRSSGIGPDEVRNANSRAHTRLSVDSLVALAAKGWR